ncbi:MAG: MarR family transcriptional regulator, partial [Cellvibrionaceae bacterium]|nr:MarR family transcriptional regulator [Cellvibrionaceae bacterium]
LGAVHGLALSEYMVLQALMQAPKQQLRRVDVAEALGRTASGITRMLRPMEKVGLVAKVAAERDGRVSLVTISDAGRELYLNASLSIEQKGQSLLNNLEAKERQQLLQLLNKL